MNELVCVVICLGCLVKVNSLDRLCVCLDEGYICLALVTVLWEKGYICLALVTVLWESVCLIRYILCSCVFWIKCEFCFMKSYVWWMSWERVSFVFAQLSSGAPCFFFFLLSFVVSSFTVYEVRLEELFNFVKYIFYYAL